MERQFRINWPAIVEEAKQRRKAQKLTQQRLAALAKVSVPTLSRFENNEKDLQLSSVMSILGVLGMVDQRQLVFAQQKANYDFDRSVLKFKGQDGDKTILCGISQIALDDYFYGMNQDPLKIFKKNRARIEHEARKKYLANQLEPDGSVLIKTEDF